MLRLIEPKNTIALMQELGIGTKKRFGQNFLIDERVLSRIIEGAEIGKEDTVLEIGPGIGTMTQELCAHAGRVIAVEIDQSLIPVLERTLAEYDNVTVINEDVLKCDLDALCGGRFKVVANLPYYITTPIIMQLLEHESQFESITVMVQKEVADRMQASPGTKDYGALSLAVQYYCSAKVIAKVPANCFIPRPNVDSAVICLKKYALPPVEVSDRGYLFRVIRAAFGQRRKTLQNALSAEPQLGLTKERIRAALAACGLDESIRGERLSLAEFAALAEVLRGQDR